MQQDDLKNEELEKCNDSKGLKKSYTFLKWNGKYGAGAKFVVKDNNTGKQTIFTPGRLQDVAWADGDLAAEHGDWDDFGEEQVEDLAEVVF